MQGLPAIVRTFWQYLNDRLGQLPHISGSRSYAEITQSPLLDRNAIAELRNRAIQLLQSHKHDRLVFHPHHGESQSPRRGPGLDYEESRVFVTGDDRRLINWRLTARSNDLHVKVYRDERQPSVFILLDRRNSMRFGTRVRLKVTQATRAAILIAFYQHFLGRMVTGANLEKTLQWLAHANSETAILALAENMNRPCPITNWEDQPQSLLRSLYVLQGSLSTGTRIYIISDFYGLTEDYRAILAQLASQHHVTAVHILDPAEFALPRAGSLRMTDSTADMAREIDTDDTTITMQYATLAEQYRTRCESILRSAGITYSRLVTDTDNIEIDLIPE